MAGAQMGQVSLRPKGRASQRQGRAHTEQRREMQLGEAEARAPGAVKGVRPPGRGPKGWEDSGCHDAASGCMRGFGGKGFRKTP